VPPRKYDQMADAVIRLLRREDLRNDYEVKARQRALELFDINISLDSYYESYVNLARQTSAINLEMEKINRQRLLAERAYALLEIGKREEGVKLLKDAIKERPGSRESIDLVNTLRDVYQDSDDEAVVINERARADYIKKIMDETKTA